MLSKFILETCVPDQTAEQSRLAHDWVNRLGEHLLLKARADTYAEFGLIADQAAVAELLEVMTVGDLLVRPGDAFGKVYPFSWETDDGMDKMGLYSGDRFPVPPKTSRAYLAVIGEQFEAGGPPLYFVGIGQEYARGSQTFHQLVGMAAHPDGYVDAMRLTYASPSSCKSILEYGESRPMPYADAWTFVDCARELCELPRESFVKC